MNDLFNSKAFTKKQYRASRYMANTHIQLSPTMLIVRVAFLQNSRGTL